MATNKNRRRLSLLKRDGNKCKICGFELSDTDISIDHIIAKCNGGSNRLENLQLVHRHCNSMKNQYIDEPIYKGKKPWAKERMFQDTVEIQAVRSTGEPGSIRCMTKNGKLTVLGFSPSITNVTPAARKPLLLTIWYRIKGMIGCLKNSTTIFHFAFPATIRSHLNSTVTTRLGIQSQQRSNGSAGTESALKPGSLNVSKFLEVTRTKS